MRFKTIAGSLLVSVALSCVPTAFAEKFSEEMSNPAYIPSAMDLESFRRSRSTLLDWFRLHLMLSKLLPYQIDRNRKKGESVAGNAAQPEKPVPIQTVTVLAPAPAAPPVAVRQEAGVQPVEVGEPAASLALDPQQVMIGVEQRDGMIDIFARVRNSSPDPAKARLVAAIRRADSDPDDPNSTQRFETALKEIPGWSSDYRAQGLNGARYLRLEIHRYPPGQYVMDVWAEDESGRRAGDMVQGRVVEIHGAFLKFDPADTLITSQVQEGDPVVATAPITNRGDESGKARLMAHVRPEGSTDPSTFRNFETPLVEIGASGQSSGAYNGIRWLRVEMKGLPAGRYLVSVSATGSDGYLIGEILYYQPVEVITVFSVVTSQANSGGIPSFQYLVERRDGTTYHVDHRLWGRTMTDYLFDGGTKAVTVRAFPSDPVTYTAAADPERYRDALVQMRIKTQGAYDYFQEYVGADMDGARRAKIQSVIDAINRELN